MYYKPHPEVFLCSELVNAVYLAGEKTTVRLTANLEEISEHRLLLLADEPITPGTDLEVRCKSRTFNGKVESAELDGVLGWFIQMRLDQCAPLGTGFVPEHALAVKRGMPGKKSPKVFPLRAA